MPKLSLLTCVIRGQKLSAPYLRKMNSKKLQIWLPLLFSIAIIIGMFLGYKMRDAMPGKSFFYTEKTKPVQEIIDLIQNKYVDDIDMNALSDTAIKSILAKLDPHTVYIPASELQKVNEELEGTFFGIGVEFNIFDDTINVVNILNDGPAYKAGLQVGDKFLKVGDSLIAGKNSGITGDIARKYLRGDRNTEVKITILRGNTQKTVIVTRDAVPITSLDASYMMDKTTGFIRLNKFSQQTYREFMMALEALKKQGLQKLVLDLRGNGGGILQEAVEIADEFLDGDKLITYTEGKHSPKKEYRCRREGQFEKGALVVLADEGTASASEILIGALQDWDRATIIGRRTFGKGLVQDQFDLSDNSALRLTIARYYTPIGRSIQRPYTNGDKAYYEEITNRYHNGETLTADSIKNDKSKVYKTKGGKTVYGGGGITPDYFIPIDTTGFGLNTAKVYAKGIINVFAYKFYLQNEAVFKKYAAADAFAKNFLFDENDWQQFVAAAAKDSINLANVAAKEKEDLESHIKSAIGRQIWRTEGFFEVENAGDDAVKKALEVLK